MQELAASLFSENTSPMCASSMQAVNERSSFQTRGSHQVQPIGPSQQSPHKGAIEVEPHEIGESLNPLHQHAMNPHPLSIDEPPHDAPNKKIFRLLSVYKGRNSAHQQLPESSNPLPYPTRPASARPSRFFPLQPWRFRKPISFLG